VANTVDPVGGSYAIESLTNAIETAVVDTLNRIDRAGGTLAAIEAGLIQREIQESAYRAQQAVDSGESVVVGVNRFNASGPTGGSETSRPTLDVFAIDPDAERRQIARVRALRASRSPDAWRAAVDGVVRTARDGGNLVPPIVAAVEARATVGEIADALRLVFGEYQGAATI
jgi:methylmalonyl-CoA mutase N-terminal domain/subunit